VGAVLRHVWGASRGRSGVCLQGCTLSESRTCACRRGAVRWYHAEFHGAGVLTRSPQHAAFCLFAPSRCWRKFAPTLLRGHPARRRHRLGFAHRWFSSERHSCRRWSFVARKLLGGAATIALLCIGVRARLDALADPIRRFARLGNRRALFDVGSGPYLAPRDHTGARTRHQLTSALLVHFCCGPHEPPCTGRRGPAHRWRRSGIGARGSGVHTRTSRVQEMRHEARLRLHRWHEAAIHVCIVRCLRGPRHETRLGCLSHHMTSHSVGLGLRLRVPQERAVRLGMSQFLRSGHRLRCNLRGLHCNTSLPVNLGLHLDVSLKSGIQLRWCQLRARGLRRRWRLSHDASRTSSCGDEAGVESVRRFGGRWGRCNEASCCGNRSG